ncbi:MAG: DDE-type integrase/transposase/recombinase, partial [Staphylococcus equorum]|nr:DDE-type integrase/transposase/recombinase [Staphylococcus equorum]
MLQKINLSNKETFKSQINRFKKRDPIKGIAKQAFIEMDTSKISEKRKIIWTQYNTDILQYLTLAVDIRFQRDITDRELNSIQDFIDQLDIIMELDSRLDTQARVRKLNDYPINQSIPQFGKFIEEILVLKDRNLDLLEKDSILTKLNMVVQRIMTYHGDNKSLDQSVHKIIAAKKKNRLSIPGDNYPSLKEIAQDIQLEISTLIDLSNNNTLPQYMQSTQARRATTTTTPNFDEQPIETDRLRYNERRGKQEYVRVCIGCVREVPFIFFKSGTHMNCRPRAQKEYSNNQNHEGIYKNYSPRNQFTNNSRVQSMMNNQMAHQSHKNKETEHPDGELIGMFNKKRNNTNYPEYKSTTNDLQILKSYNDINKSMDDSNESETDSNKSKFSVKPNELLIVRENYSSAAVTDSGSTKTMTNDPEKFKSISHTHELIEIADGNYMHAVGRGAYDYTIYDQSGNPKTITFEDVLFVPELQANLLSLNDLVKLGTVEFTPKYVYLKLYDSTDILIVAIRNEESHWIAPNSDNKLDLSIQPTVKPVSEKAYRVSEINKDTLSHWHNRFLHTNVDTLKLMYKNNLVTGMDLGKKYTNLGKCEICELAHAHKQPFRSRPHITKATAPLELIHSDLCEFNIPSYAHGYRYIITILDDFTRYHEVHLLRHKNDAGKIIADFIGRAQQDHKKMGYKVKALFSDNGGEFIHQLLNDYLYQHHIIHYFSPPYTPQQNGRIERLNRTLIEKMVGAILQARLPPNIWEFAIKHSSWIINNVTHSATGKIPQALWDNTTPNVSDLKIFGCRAYVHQPRQHKGGASSITGIFIGMGQIAKTWDILTEDGIITTHNVTFDETKFGLPNNWNGKTFVLSLMKSSSHLEQTKETLLTQLLGSDH